MGRVEEILDRLAGLVGAKNHSELSDYLEVSRTTVGSWKQRQTIPIKRLMELATERGFSLDHLLLGRNTQDPAVNLSVFNDVCEALVSDESELRALAPADFARNAALVYNQVASVTDEQERAAVLAGAVRLINLSVARRSLEGLDDPQFREFFHGTPERSALTEEFRDELMKKIRSLGEK